MKFVLKLCVFVCLLTGCTKSFLKDDVGGALIGDWHLVRLYETCSVGGIGLECNNGFAVSADFDLTVKKNGRVVSYQDGEELWCGKLKDVRFEFSQQDIDVVILEWKNEIRTAGNFSSAYLACDTIYLFNFPNPTLTREDDHILGDRVAVYARD